jgi:hypothetical protein
MLFAGQRQIAASIQFAVVLVRCSCCYLSCVLPDLVFLQNGMLQPWLDSRGLGDNTQVGAKCTACSSLQLVQPRAQGRGVHGCGAAANADAI